MDGWCLRSSIHLTRSIICKCPITEEKVGTLQRLHCEHFATVRSASASCNQGAVDIECQNSLD